jgi:hypothetical protein
MDEVGAPENAHLLVVRLRVRSCWSITDFVHRASPRYAAANLAHMARYGLR